MNVKIMSLLYNNYKHTDITVATNGLSHYSGEWDELDFKGGFIKLIDDSGNALFVDMSSITSISVNGERREEC